MTKAMSNVKRMQNMFLFQADNWEVHQFYSLGFLILSWPRKYFLQLSGNNLLSSKSLFADWTCWKFCFGGLIYRFGQKMNWPDTFVVRRLKSKETAGDSSKVQPIFTSLSQKIALLILIIFTFISLFACTFCISNIQSIHIHSSIIYFQQ